MNLTTFDRQEIFAVKKIGAWAERAENLEKVKLVLDDFQGKPSANSKNAAISSTGIIYLPA